MNGKPIYPPMGPGVGGRVVERAGVAAAERAGVKAGEAAAERAAVEREVAVAVKEGRVTAEEAAGLRPMIEMGELAAVREALSGATVAPAVLEKATARMAPGKFAPKPADVAEGIWAGKTWWGVTFPVTLPHANVPPRQQREWLLKKVNEISAEMNSIIRDQGKASIGRAEEAQAQLNAAQTKVEILITAEKPSPRDIRLAEMQLRQLRDAYHDAVREGSSTERYLRLAGQRDALRNAINETKFIPRFVRALEAWQILNPRLALYANPPIYMLKKLKEWPKIAGAIAFSLFIMEEASQALGMALSFRIRGAKDRMSDPTVTSDAQFSQWKSETRALITKFRIQTKAFQWWTDYPGILALFMAIPYEHYVSAAWGQLDEIERLMGEIEEDRARYQRGERVPFTKGIDIAIGQAIEGAFDAAESLNYGMNDLLKRDEMATIRSFLPTFEELVTAAKKQLEDPEIKLYLKRNPYTAISAAGRSTNLEKAIEKWDVLIANAARGGPLPEIGTEDRPTEELPEPADQRPQ